MATIDQKEGFRIACGESHRRKAARAEGLDNGLEGVDANGPAAIAGTAP